MVTFEQGGLYSPYLTAFLERDAVHFPLRLEANYFTCCRATHHAHGVLVSHDENGVEKLPGRLPKLSPTQAVLRDELRGYVETLAGEIGERNVFMPQNLAAAANRERVQFPSEGGALPGALPGIGWSDHCACWQVGYPAPMATDTAPFRWPYYHTIEDTPDKLDYDRLTRVVEGWAALSRTWSRAD